MLYLFVVSVSAICQNSCTSEKLNDLECHLECMTESCNFQNLNPTCLKNCLESGCTIEKLTNTNCDSSCNTLVCAWDFGSCGYCSQGCFVSDLNSCSTECDVPECSNGLYCQPAKECSPGCYLTMVGDGICENECLTRSCLYDSGDCQDLQIAPDCYLVQIADGICDQACNTDVSYWDGWDCGCSPGCSPALLSNEVCDDECNTSSCNYDQEKCLYCAENCRIENIGDSICDMACYNLDCWFDLGDCDCAIGCNALLLGNTQCDSICNSLQCGYDNYACYQCSDNCDSSLRQNQICDIDCNNADCFYDDYDCLCAKDCYPELLTNSQCDSACNTSWCEFDNNFCTPCAEGCLPFMLSDGKCDLACNTLSCNYDGWDCTCSPYCTDDLLVNTQCDQACNTISCNFDNYLCIPCICNPLFLANGICDLDCNTEQCAYDGGDCDCSENCEISMLGNGVCNDECNNALCAYDLGDCEYCAENCKWADVGDGVCQVWCFVQECYYDISDCSCNENCPSSDLINYSCDDGCRISQCNYDNFMCLECSAGCLTSMLGDGICDPACYNAACGYDLTDCSCSPLCSSITQCDYSCIISPCDYSKSICESGEIVISVINQWLENDYNAVWDPEPCVSIDQNCISLILDSQCDSLCNVQECLYDMGSCSICADPLCLRCINSFCIECQSGYYSLKGQCLSYIPRAFTLYEDFAYILIPRTDVSSYQNPFEIYIAPSKVSAYEDGSFDNPYSSLAVGLSAIWCKFNKVILLKGTHYLTPADLSIKEIVYSMSPFVLLSSTNAYHVVNITTLMCYEDDRIGCADEPAIVLYMGFQVRFLVEYKSLLQISNVIFDGSLSLDNTCLHRSCKYCPYFEEEDGVYYNDKGQPFDRRFMSTACEDYHGLSFLSFAQGGSLVMKNVTFNQFQQQFGALLDLSGTSSVFVNVSFLYIQASTQPNSAVIKQNSGSLIWILGLVTFLNYGYEYISTLSLTPFLYIENSSYLQLKYLMFEWNIAYGDQSSIIHIKNSQIVQIEFCSFSYNWAESIIFIDQNSWESLNHIIIRSCGFQNNVVNFGGVINIINKKDPKTLLIDSCIFSSNTLANGQGIVSITGYENSIGDMSEIVLNNLQFIGNIGGGVICLGLYGQNGLRISNIQVLSGDLSINHPLEAFISKSSELGYYLSQIRGPNFSSCSSILQVSNCSNYISLSLLSFQDQYCNTIIFLNNNAFVDFQQASLLNNFPSQSVLNLNSNLDSLVSSSLFSNNTSTYSVILIQNQENAIFYQNQLLYNQALKGTINAYNSNISISQCQFTNNIGDLGSAIFYQALQNSFLSIFSSLFSLNIVNEGTVYISSTETSEHSVSLYINKCSFTSNSAVSGSGLFIKSHTLSVLSSVMNTNFEYNLGSFLGLLVINDNPISITYCQFLYNIASQATVLYISRDTEADIDMTIILESSLISSNIGESIVFGFSLSDMPVLIIRNSGLVNNTGNTVYLQKIAYNMINTMCIANKAQDGACIYASHSSVYITDCLIQYNMGSTGGAVKISDGSFISCSNCTFDTNFANYGGAIIFTDGGYGNFTNSLFTGNISPYYGPAIFAISSSNTGIIVNSTNFLSNIVGISGVISIVQSAGYLYSSNFTTNIAMNYSPGISTSMGNLTIHGCRFYNQSGFYGSFVSLGTLSFAEIYDSEFELGNSNEGGALVIATSLAYIVRCSFKHMKGTHGGTISVNTMAYLYMTDVVIYNSTCTNKGGAIYDIESTLVLTNVSFENFQDSAIYADKASLIQATNSSFINGGSIENGGGIMCISCISIIITNSVFSTLNAKSGGSIYMYYQENQAKPSCLISSTSFQYNSAIQGGAITSQDYNLTIINSNFSYNSALGSEDLWGSAGSILFSCSINDKCNLFLTDTSFANNYARELGGCITWSGTQPLMLSNTFTNNTAIYGPEIASFPVAMKLLSNGEILNENFELLDIAPGQLVSTILEIVLLDHYGQIVKTENETSAALYSNKTGAIVSGTTVVSALNGIVTFDNYYIYGEPGSNLTMIVKSSEMSDAENINIPVSLRDCLIGESLSSKACVECNKGQYSLDPSGPCLECLAEAICYGNYSMVPKQGYWRTNMYSTTFYKCPFTEACLGGGDNFSLTGECAQGYWSNLCQSCEKGYSHSSTSLCQKCPSMEKNIIYLSLIIVFITLCVCALVYINISMADKPASNYTILIKILLNYIQIIGVVASLNLDWPDFALEYLKIQETAGSLSQQSFSFDCFVADKYDRTNNQVYFDKIILYLLMPVFIIIVCLFLWSLVALIKLDAKYIKNHFVGSVVIIVFLLHTIIVRISLAPFSCKKIENDYWLNDDLSIKCWTGMHQVYTLSLALPGLIIWCIFVPFTAIFFTYRNKLKFEQLEIKQRYGYIIAGYNYERYYWEFVIMYRKVFVISASLFFGSLSVELQTLSVLIILLVSSYMQADLKPFYSPELNKMEFRSILVSVVTIYCGLYYLTPNVSTTGRIILFILLVSFNTTFFGYWAYYFVKEFSKAAIDIFKSILRRFRKKVVPEVEMEEMNEEKPQLKIGFPVVHVETNDNNIIVEDKDFEEEEKVSYEIEKVEQLKVIGESRRGALTFIDNQREHSSVVNKKQGLRMTVRYNAFDDSL